MLSLWAKVRGWCVTIGAVLLGVLMAVIFAFRKGSATAAASIEAS